MKTTKKDITKVVFRKYSDGEIIALFPQIICTNGGEILSYMHVGQHGAASVDIVRKTKAATLAEFFPLYKELKAIGYNMKIGKRLTKKGF